ncbi:MAG TPA: AAA domain-containing protein [Ktedonobacteraceae bacterium]|nr:AAA domain-containing protein [Ktedonobacteraceae bacterium]
MALPDLDHRDEAGETAEAQQDCFLCVLDQHPCAQKRIEGSIRAVAQRKIDGAWTPFITLNTGTALISLQLTRYYLSLVQELKRLEEQNPRKRLGEYNLTLRVYHLPPLVRTGEFKEWPVYHYQANQYTLAVLEPDILLNITDLSQSEYCSRQYLLKQLVPSSSSAAAVSGNLVHHSFKELLKEHDRGALMAGYAGEETPLATLQRHFEQELERSSLDLALADLSPTAIRERVEPHLSSLANWFARERYSLWDMPDSTQETGDDDGEEISERENIVRAETFLLAPEIGLRGRLDLLWQQSSHQRLLELKTGAFSGDSPKHEHRWQVFGYHALLAVRRNSRMKKAAATLLYSATPGSATAFPVRFSIINLQRVNEVRNLLVLGHITGIAPAPPGPARCTRCSLLAQCGQVSSLLGWQPPQPDLAAGGNGSIISETATGLHPTVTQEERAFFEKFYRLLRIEGLEGEKRQALLWQETLEERVARGAAIQRLVPDGEPEPTGQGEWWQTFRCDNTSELRAGDEILLSDGDPVTGEVVTGTVVAISAEKVTVWTPELIARPRRIDSYDTDRVHVRTLKNLVRWLQSDSRLRSLVAGQTRPAFRHIPVPARADFNTEQNLAVERAMQMQDYLLVHGPPGTGKTAVIAEIVKRLHGQGQRVLLAAFTNQAVDNMLKRLDKEGFHDYVRLGHERNVDPEILPRLLKKLAQQWQAESTDEAKNTTNDRENNTPTEEAQPTRQEETQSVRTLLRQMSVVASTTATWSSDTYDFLFPGGDDPPWQFDVAIIDEAGQLTIPAILGALRFAKRFILVGDEKQLPPLVLSEDAAKQGLAQSLFGHLKRLDDDYMKAHAGETGACVPLRVQYRMNEGICEFASRMFYDGELVAHPSVARRQLDVTKRGVKLPGESDAIARALLPLLPTVFLDVRETGERRAKTSDAEARTVRDVVAGLLARGIAGEDIGIIAPYRAQVASLRRHLFDGNSESGREGLPPDFPLTVDTVDRFQGGERKVIIISFATGKTPDAPSLLRDFLTNPNRLNVALTRAQRKLILIGNASALKTLPVFRELLLYCKYRNALIPHTMSALAATPR